MVPLTRHVCSLIQEFNKFHVRLHNAMQGVSRLRPVGAKEVEWRVGNDLSGNCSTIDWELG